MAAKNAASKSKVTRRTITEEIDNIPDDDHTPETPPAPPPDKSEMGYVESDDTRDFSGYDRCLRDYMQSSGGGVKDFTATLYKYDNLNKQKQYVCNSTENEMLSMHDVGMTFGSGDYRYLVSFPAETKVPPKAFRFNMHPIYDTYREKAGMTALPDPRQVPPAAAARSGILESMELMKMLIDTIKPLMSAPAVQQQNPMELMMMNYRMTQDILKSNLKENVGLYRQMADIEKNRGDDMTITDEKEPGILETIIPLIERFAPMLLGSNPASAAMVQAVKAAPEFKKALKNPDELQMLIGAVEQKLGKAETDAILKRLNVRRPQ